MFFVSLIHYRTSGIIHNCRHDQFTKILLPKFQIIPEPYTAKLVRGDSKMQSNDSPEIQDRGETSDIPGLPSGVNKEEGLVLAIQALYENSSSAVLSNSKLEEFFKTRVGVCQECLFSPVLFNLFLEKILQETLHDLSLIHI